MAQSLRLNVIAEGVEAKEQMKFLYSLNCTAMQGFYFSKPLSAGDFSPLLRKPRWRKGLSPPPAHHRRLITDSATPSSFRHSA